MGMDFPGGIVTMRKMQVGRDGVVRKESLEPLSLWGTAVGGEALNK